MEKLFKIAALVVAVAFLAAPVAGCATSMFNKNVSAMKCTQVEIKCADEKDAGPCFKSVCVPAGETTEERSTWCEDHKGLCYGAIGVGVAAVLGGTAAVYCAASGNCVPEGGGGATFNMQGGK